MANFLSQPILTGYLNGIALLIIVGQLPKLFGYSASSPDLLGQLVELVQRFELSHWPTALLGPAMLALLVAVMRFLPKLPGPSSWPR
jgi:MFS superfamily sulfate permease-like transporter